MLSRLVGFVRSALDPRPWFHVVRLVHYYNYSHVTPLRRASVGERVALAPNVSFRYGERITIGAGSQIGERCSLWAGSRHGRITIGDHALFGPEVYVTASNYEVRRGIPVMDQPTIERDVVIGSNVWLGRGVVVLPGVEIGDGCIVGAGAVVSRSLPPDSIAVGVPARSVAERR